MANANGKCQFVADSFSKDLQLQIQPHSVIPWVRTTVYQFWREHNSPITPSKGEEHRRAVSVFMLPRRKLGHRMAQGQKSNKGLYRHSNSGATQLQLLGSFKCPQLCGRLKFTSEISEEKLLS